MPKMPYVMMRGPSKNKRHVFTLGVTYKETYQPRKRNVQAHQVGARAPACRPPRRTTSCAAQDGQ
jgi:hypothetical protein